MPRAPRYVLQEVRPPPPAPRPRRVRRPQAVEIGEHRWARQMAEHFYMSQYRHGSAWLRCEGDRLKEGAFLSKRLNEFLKKKYPDIRRPEDYILPDERYQLIQILRSIFEGLSVG